MKTVKTKAKYPHQFAYGCTEGRWKAYDYLQSLSKYIAHGMARGSMRLIVSMPPRHGKSELISHWLPRWYLEGQPERRIILATYADQFAVKWGRKVRNGIRSSPLHRRARLASDKEAASNFYTTEGGGMLSAGIRGGITGEGADLMIIDDPIKNWEQANSPGIREKINEEFEATLNTRLEPGASVIVLMTRWHTEDLAGFAQDRYNWEFLRFPAIADKQSVQSNHLDGRNVGEALCPDRYPLPRLEEIESNLTQVMWSALYQQTPSDMAEGRAIQPESAETMFKPELGEWPGDNGDLIEARTPGTNLDFYAGADWAKDQDWSIFTVLGDWGDSVEEPQPLEVVAWMRIGRKPWPQMIRAFNDLVEKYDAYACHDATGVGEVVDDHLKVHSEGHDFRKRKQTHEMLSQYIGAIEDEEIISPDIQYMKTEHKRATHEQIYGTDHLPDTIASGALAYRAYHQYAFYGAV